MSGSKAHRPVWLRITASAAIALFGVTVIPPPAASSSQLCSRLESQLVSAQRPASGGQVRRYDKAIRAQEVELEKTRAMAANAGCGGFFSALRGQCGSLNATISRMENNLIELRQQRVLLAGGGDPRREKARILAALDANGCRATREAGLRQLPGVSSGQPALFQQLYGEKTKQEPAKAEDGMRGGAAGSYRTLCVRTCDGYFFPIAYSSSAQSFDRDAKACEAACPGTEVELFRHRVPAEEAEQAVSVRTGASYADLPNAFLYRRADYSRPAACGCNPPKDFSVVAGGRYEPAEDPVPEIDAEEAAITDDDVTDAPDLFAEAPDAEPLTSSVEEKKTAERRVRVGGPMFLPDPEEAIDLRAPGRKRAP